MIDALSIAKKYFNISECDVPAEFKTMKNAKMNTSIEQYYIDGLGNITFQHAKAMFGLMKMEMMTITPIERDIPLFSYDVVEALGNYTLIIEIYDVMLDKSDKIEIALEDIKKDYSDLPDDDRGEHWYDNIKMASSVSKKGKKKLLDARCDELYSRYLEAYFSLSKEMNEVANKEAKRAASDAYVQGLLDNGGPSTDVFVEMLGKEKTTEYFKKYIFGTEK